MHRFAFTVLLLVSLSLVAGAMPVVPYDQDMDDRVLVDGYVDREQEGREYPFEFVNEATGITVSWGYDDSLIYVALETRGQGWFGIGFGSPRMDGSNMVIGFDTDEETEVFCLVGKGNGHDIAGTADDLLPEWDIDYDDETGITTLEFAYPLRWRGEGVPEEMAGNEVLKRSAIGGLEPGDVYDMILAQNARTASLEAKHTHIARLKFQMGEKPEEETEPEKRGDY